MGGFCYPEIPTADQSSGLTSQQRALPSHAAPVRRHTPQTPPESETARLLTRGRRSGILTSGPAGQTNRKDQARWMLDACALRALRDLRRNATCLQRLETGHGMAEGRKRVFAAIVRRDEAEARWRR